MDLSSPLEWSVNDFIDLSLCSLSYASMEDAAAFAIKAGQGTLLSAYPIHPGDWHLLGMQWRDKVFVSALSPQDFLMPLLIH